MFIVSATVATQMEPSNSFAAGTGSTSFWKGSRALRFRRTCKPWSTTPLNSVSFIPRCLRLRSRHPQQTLHPHIDPVLTRSEVDALFCCSESTHVVWCPASSVWFGRRDHAFLLVVVQTGLRLCEMTGLKRKDLIVGSGAHLGLIGKGRKERCTPLAKSSRTATR